MNEHFIKNIKIEKFKCFENFKAKGFSRVNLITGKNNVGKTAFMEACFLLSNSFNIFKSHNGYNSRKGALGIDRDWFHFELVKLMLEVQQNRGGYTFFTQWLKEEARLDFDDFEIIINEKFQLRLNAGMIYPDHFCVQSWGNWGSYFIDNFRRNKRYDKIYIKNNPPILDNRTFVSICNDSKKIHKLIGNLKINNNIDPLNHSLEEMFDCQELDVINDEIMLKAQGNFTKLSNFGDGIRHFINIFVILLSNENDTIYLDEIDNGIHYSKFDGLWELVLKTSKALDVQVFATTHSKECIESYARVVKKLEDKEITLIRLARLKSGAINAGVFDYGVLESAISQEHEVRG
ncbi:AAA family ATPase [Bathymodiolus thermophilus thioautotrophic gill symbiont]|uniref:ATPase AAA-type core domain-containing protein n=1 Tax=Bathymodiolus thermophilus thioautotrophic gill symbiont TaxID=2360 RepID=A0A1J5U9G0_9GAMM|nr:AAA family ATPase [Bathymodiolus thermophilus thioautotrophic gill symbiont]OIR25478.1 hypothetical protein BGC33_13520 [Bathymodiolus thermophilus thioautotrophic gill symbiont]